MQHNDCDHVGHERYARRAMNNGGFRYCVQCKKCKAVLKTKKHGFKLWIKQSEIPSESLIFPFFGG